MDSTDQAYGFPLLEDDDPREASKKHTGNWKACSLTLVCFFCSYLAFSSITKNLVSYLTESLHETNVAAARNVSTWHGTSYLAPLVGAFLADSYLGQYWTTVIFCTIFIVGMVMLVLSAAVPLTATDFRNREEALLQEYVK
ncbi:hypothetical protein QOZ80_3BG0281290 [Eleusine coracana subsp. coracana]|nr:hypothetical protein QOZ80_3BG0281290 [Eleusine coracana subsp. coracana]